jgi:hypothetical protein
MNSDDDPRRAADEAVFRDANEQIREADRRLDPAIDRVPYICECDDVTCHELIPLTHEEYEAVRADPTQFAILPGHPTNGEVLDERDEYLVVRKTGAEAVVSRVLDPRKDSP